MFGSLSSKIAHTSTLPVLGNQDLKALQELINAEKNLLGSVERLSQELTKSSDALKAWGSGEGNDIGDILANSAAIFSHVSTAFNRFATHELNIRAHMKYIRTREEQLEETNRRRRAVGIKAEAAEKKLNKMGAENKNLPMQTDLLAKLRDEMTQLDRTIETEEAQLWHFKRKTTKTFLTLKFAGLVELAEKCTIVGELGKLIIEEIPLGYIIPGGNPPQYNGYERTVNLVAEASRCINEVIFNPALISPSSPKRTEEPVLRRSDSLSDKGAPTNTDFGPIHTTHSKASPSLTLHSSITGSPDLDFSAPEFGHIRRISELSSKAALETLAPSPEPHPIVGVGQYSAPASPGLDRRAWGPTPESIPTGNGPSVSLPDDTRSGSLRSVKGNLSISVKSSEDISQTGQASLRNLSNSPSTTSVPSRLLDPPGSRLAAANFSSFPVKSQRERKASINSDTPVTPQVNPGHDLLPPSKLSQPPITPQGDIPTFTHGPIKEVHHVRFAIEAPEHVGGNQQANISSDDEDSQLDHRYLSGTDPPVDSERDEPHLASITPLKWKRNQTAEMTSAETIPGQPWSPTPIPSSVTTGPTITSDAELTRKHTANETDSQDIGAQQDSSLAPVIISDDKDLNAAAALAISREIEALSFYRSNNVEPSHSSPPLTISSNNAAPHPAQPLHYTPVSAFSRDSMSNTLSQNSLAPTHVSAFRKEKKPHYGNPVHASGSPQHLLDQPAPPPWLSATPPNPLSGNVLTGAPTVTAGAFRRPPPRSPTLPPEIDDGSNPLGARKRMLPSSPYPARPTAGNERNTSKLITTSILKPDPLQMHGSMGGFEQPISPDRSSMDQVTRIDTSLEPYSPIFEISPSNTGNRGPDIGIPESLRPGKSPTVASASVTPISAHSISRIGKPTPSSFNDHDLRLPEINPLSPDFEFEGVRFAAVRPGIPENEPRSNPGSPRLLYGPAAGTEPSSRLATNSGYSEGRFATNLEGETRRS